MSVRDSLASLFSDLPKSSFRTKTAAGIASLMFGDLEDFLKPDVCHAALKEEAKPWFIVSTPMHSYVTMCYIFALLGKPFFLKSTITSASRLEEFARYYAKHYAAIDALQFDPKVPRWLLEMIWEELAFP